MAICRIATFEIGGTVLMQDRLFALSAPVSALDEYFAKYGQNHVHD